MRYPSPQHAHLKCNTPRTREGYLRDMCAIPHENEAKRVRYPLCDTISEDAMGGWKKEGGGKPHEWHPSQKGVLDPPPRTVRFPPPSGVSALFFLYKSPRQSRPEALLEGSKKFRESAFSGTFSSPHTFCPPPISRPNYLKRVFRDMRGGRYLALGC